jgi:hypothetical protein
MMCCASDGEAPHAASLAFIAGICPHSCAVLVGALAGSDKPKIPSRMICCNAQRLLLLVAGLYAASGPRLMPVRSQNVVCTARDVYLTVNRFELTAGWRPRRKDEQGLLEVLSSGPTERCRRDRSASVGRILRRCRWILMAARVILGMAHSRGNCFQSSYAASRHE